MLSSLPDELIVHIATFSLEMRRLLRPVGRQFQTLLHERVPDEYSEIKRYILNLMDILERCPRSNDDYIGFRKGLIKKMIGIYLMPRWRGLISRFHPSMYEDVIPDLLRRLRRSDRFVEIQIYQQILESNILPVISSPLGMRLLCLSCGS